MKKLVSILLAVIMTTSLFVGCTPAKKTTGFKVAMHNAFNNNGWRVRYENQIQEVIDELKAQNIVTQYDKFCSNGDASLQTQQIEQTINEGYDIILVNPISGTGLDPVIDKALKKGITYVNVDCVYESDKILNITTDQADWAQQNIDHLIKAIDEKGNILMFNGLDGNSASETRTKVWKDTLTKYPNIKVVKEVAHGWDQTKSKQLMSEIIASGIQYDAILNQEAGLGILQAIEEAKQPWPKAICSDEEVGYLRKLSKIDATNKVIDFYIVENPPGIGATALKFAIRLAEGKKLKDGVITDPKFNAIYLKPQWNATYDTMAKAVDETKDLPETEYISTYLPNDKVDTYFQ